MRAVNTKSGVVATGIESIKWRGTVRAEYDKQMNLVAAAITNIDTGKVRKIRKGGCTWQHLQKISAQVRYAANR